MKITRASDFAIRLLVHLASKGGEGTSQELAKEINVSFNHLAKLVPILARHGFIITQKGKGGGIRLVKNPRKIDLAEVIEAIEGPIVISDCIFHKSSCCFSKKCKARKCLNKVRQGMLKILSKTTVKELVAN